MIRDEGRWMDPLIAGGMDEMAVAVGPAGMCQGAAAVYLDARHKGFAGVTSSACTNNGG